MQRSQLMRWLSASMVSVTLGFLAGCSADTAEDAAPVEGPKIEVPATPSQTTTTEKDATAAPAAQDSGSQTKPE